MRDQMEQLGGNGMAEHAITAPATEAAQQWDGWGTALKPAFEPIVVARKPLSERTVAANVLRWGTGALNIDGSRIDPAPGDKQGKPQSGMSGRTGGIMSPPVFRTRETAQANPAGRWPANVILDEGQAAQLDQQSGSSVSPNGPVKQGGRKSVGGTMNGYGEERDGEGVGYGDSGGASRFFKVAQT